MIQITGLDIGYGKKKVIQDLNLDIKRGESVFLAGANGSGKTTLLRALSGVLFVYGGEIVVEGKKLSEETRKKIAYIPSSLSFYDGLKLRDALTLQSSIYKPFTYQEIGGYSFDLDRRVNSLSKGEKTLFFLSLALSSFPDYLLIDDVIHFLDPHLREIFLKNILRLIEEEQLGLIIAAQSCSDIEGILERVVILDKGKKVMDESVENIKKTFVKVFTEDVPQDLPVVFEKEWKNMKEIYVYPYEKNKHWDGKIEYLSLSEILRAFIGGEYDFS